ncbi:unnamed protein product, partial [marine sediment metagenome]
AVTGTVNSVECAWNGEHSQILTTIRIRVQEDFKGNVTAPDGVLTLTELGGTVGQTTMIVEHAPSFAVGEEVLVFTEQAADGRLIVLGRTQGKTTLKNSTDPAVRSATKGAITFTRDAQQMVVQVRQAMIHRGYTPILRSRAQARGWIPASEQTLAMLESGQKIVPGPDSPLDQDMSWADQRLDAAAEHSGMVLGRRSIPGEKWEEGGVFSEEIPEQEVLEYRTRISKTFDNGDDRRVSYFVGPVHYRDAAGAWQDICYDMTDNDSEQNREY